MESFIAETEMIMPDKLQTDQAHLSKILKSVRTAGVFTLFHSFYIHVTNYFFIVLESGKLTLQGLQIYGPCECYLSEYDSYIYTFLCFK